MRIPLIAIPPIATPLLCQFALLQFRTIISLFPNVQILGLKYYNNLAT